jgi:adenosine deaminase
VAEAIELLGAERIGHGVRVFESQHSVDVAVAQGTTFEVCVTSNYQSGAVPNLGAHPLVQMMKSGLDVTINTDDPSISQITLSNEYRLVCEDFGLSLAQLRERILAAAQSAFLPSSERKQLLQRLTDEFPTEEASS